MEAHRGRDRTLTVSSEFEEGRGQRQREPSRNLVVGGDLYLIFKVGRDATEDGEPEQRGGKSPQRKEAQGITPSQVDGFVSENGC